MGVPDFEARIAGPALRPPRGKVSGSDVRRIPLAIAVPRHGHESVVDGIEAERSRFVGKQIQRVFEAAAVSKNGCCTHGVIL